MMLLKKTVYDKLVTKINAVYTSGSVLKTQYNRKVSLWHWQENTWY